MDSFTVNMKLSETNKTENYTVRDTKATLLRPLIQEAVNANFISFVSCAPSLLEYSIHDTLFAVVCYLNNMEIGLKDFRGRQIASPINDRALRKSLWAPVFRIMFL